MVVFRFLIVVFEVHPHTVRIDATDIGFAATIRGDCRLQVAL